MNEEFIAQILGCMALLHNVVNVGDCGANKDGKNESNNVMVSSPNVHVYCIEDAKKGEAPGNAVNNDLSTTGEELVDDGAKQKEVNQRPNEECPRCWGDVGLLARVVDIARAGYGVDV